MDEELRAAMEAGGDDAPPDITSDRPPVITFADESLTTEITYVRMDLVEQIVDTLRITLDEWIEAEGAVGRMTSAALLTLESALVAVEVDLGR